MKKKFKFNIHKLYKMYNTAGWPLLNGQPITAAAVREYWPPFAYRYDASRDCATGRPMAYIEGVDSYDSCWIIQEP